MFKNKMTLYCCGPMTGMPDFNFPAFFELSEKLQKAGFKVENPADNDHRKMDKALKRALEVTNLPGHSWEDYMRRDIKRVLKCDAIVCLPGWRNSRGASWEVDIARKLKMPVYRWDNKLKPLIEVIGLSGYALSGKDTTAQLLEPYGWERISFADVIRDFLYTLNPRIETKKTAFGDELVDMRLKEIVDKYGWQEAKLSSLEIRELLQRLGTDCGRELIGENIWVDAVMKTLEDGHKYIFTDARFPNEALAIKEFGGKIFRITRPGFGPINNHISETALDDYVFDGHIVNNLSKEDLKKELLKKLNI